jgi:predicted dehydrogenase
MADLKFAVLGCGFWSPFQIAGWQEVGGVKLVALYNRTRSKAKALAKDFGDPAVYDTAKELFEKEKGNLDFVDIITDVDTHKKFTLLAAEHGIPVICQKPMATNYTDAKEMVDGCKKAGVPYYIHENFRWQDQVRAVKAKLDSGVIGKPFKGRITFCSSFPVFDNQPFLAELDQFILTDVGSHILDLARFLFGEAATLYCQTASMADIKGEDVATVFMKMRSGVQCCAEMSYASRLEDEHFPETYVLIEGEKGSIKLGPKFDLRVTTKDGTVKETVAPPEYPWADPEYAAIHSSIVSCNADILKSIKGEAPAETTGEDNLKTVELVFKAYESAEKNMVVKINQ